MKGAFDPGAMLNQAKKMKEDMARAERDLAQRMVEGKASRGLVSVVMTGTQEIQAVRIDPQAVDPSDIEMLEDLVVLAIRDALDKSRKLKESVYGEITGGVGGLPGLF